MIETFTALLIAHVLADFWFQTDWMVRCKLRCWRCTGPLS